MYKGQENVSNLLQWIRELKRLFFGIRHHAVVTMTPIYLTKSIGFFPEHHSLKDIILLLLYSTSNNSRAKNTATQVAMLETAN